MKEVTATFGLTDKNSNKIASKLGRILKVPKEWLDNADSLSEILDAYRDVLRQEAKGILAD